MYYLYNLPDSYEWDTWILCSTISTIQIVELYISY